jgi:hypothetical protein
VQFSGAVNLAVKRELHIWCNTVLFGVCSYNETVIVPMLKSVTRKRLIT